MCKHRVVPRCEQCRREVQCRMKYVEYDERIVDGVSCRERGCTRGKPLNRTKHYDQLPPIYLNSAPANCRSCKTKTPQQPAAQPDPTTPLLRPTQSSPNCPAVEQPCLVCQRAHRDCDYAKPQCGPCSEDWKLAGPCTYIIHQQNPGETVRRGITRRGVVRCDKCIAFKLTGCDGNGSDECIVCTNANQDAQICIYPDGAAGQKEGQAVQDGPAVATQLGSRYATQGYMQMSDSLLPTLPAFSDVGNAGSLGIQDVHGPDAEVRTPLPLHKPFETPPPRNALTMSQAHEALKRMKNVPVSTRQGRAQASQNQPAGLTEPVSSQWTTYRQDQLDDDDDLWDDTSTPPADVIQADERARQESEKNRRAHDQRSSATGPNARTAFVGADRGGLLRRGTRQLTAATDSRTTTGGEKRARDQRSQSENTNSNPATPSAHQVPKKPKKDAFRSVTAEEIEAYRLADEETTKLIEAARRAQGLSQQPARPPVSQSKRGGRGGRGGKGRNTGRGK